MDIPLSSLKYVLNSDNTKKENPRYEPYGILLTKNLAYQKGCRPVIYLSNSELKALAIPDEELWRVVRLDGLDGAEVNWTHEREWRCKNELVLPRNPHAVFVKNTSEAKRLRDLIAEDPKGFKAKPSSILPLTILCQGLPYM